MANVTGEARGTQLRVAFRLTGNQRQSRVPVGSQAHPRNIGSNGRQCVKSLCKDMFARAAMQIFLSYRRSNSEDVTGRLYDHLERRLGNQAVFKDVDAIPLGADFREVVGEAIRKSNIMLPVIGKGWISASDEAGRRRLENPADWVRLELELGLQENIRIVPLLLGSAEMPSPNELPESIRKLAFLNATKLRPDPDFKKDVDRLCSKLGLPTPPRDRDLYNAPSKLKSLLVSSDMRARNFLKLRYTLLFGSPEAIVPVSEKRLSRKSLDELLKRVHHIGLKKLGAIEHIGDELTTLIIPREMQDHLAQDPEVYLIVFHDRLASNIPWELLRISGIFPCLQAGLSRRLLSDQSFQWHPRMPYKSGEPSVLVVANPTSDLPGAEREGQEVRNSIVARIPESIYLYASGTFGNQSNIYKPSS